MFIALCPALCQACTLQYLIQSSRPYKVSTIFIPTLQVRHGASERLSHFLKVTQPGSDSSGSHTQAFVPRAWLLNSYAKPSH